MTKTNNKTWIFLIAAIAIFFLFFQGDGLQKETVAEIDGQPCINATECPCFGPMPEAYGGGQNWGVGAGRCVDGVCNMNYCFDMQPAGVAAGEWIQEKPLGFLKDNPMWVAAILALIAVLVFWK